MLKRVITAALALMMTAGLPEGLTEDDIYYTDNVDIVDNAADVPEESTMVEYDLQEEYQIPAEWQLLLQLIQAEAGGEDLCGKALVVCVVMNRVAAPDFPDSIGDVIMQPGQFTPVTTGSIWSVEPSESACLALEIALEGWDESRGALYFDAAAHGRDT